MKMEPHTAHYGLCCMQRQHIDLVWPLVERFIARAFEHYGDGSAQSIYDDLSRDEALLWIVWDNERDDIAGTFVTQIIETAKGKICIGKALAGERLKEWIGFLEEIHSYARAEGCVKFRIMGRPGWQRVFKKYGYEPPNWVTIEKGL